MSKEMGGAPVKVVWTREDDIKHGFYHTVTAERFEAGLDAANKVVAWRHRSAAPSFMANFVPDPSIPATSSWAWAGSIRPSTCPTSAWRAARRRATLRVGWFRSVNNVAHAWSIQSFIAELAQPAGQRPEGLPARDDRPGADRRSAASRSPRRCGTTVSRSRPIRSIPGACRKVTELAAEKAGWGKQLPKGQGLGIAAHRSFVSYIATVVHVEVGDKGKITIPRVDTAIDCGFCVHPERVRSQIEGAAVMGLTLAKYGEITFKGGAVEQSNFNDYQLVRIDESPKHDPRAHRRARHRRARERRGRAGSAAVRAGAVQRDLCGDGQAHPADADRRPIGLATKPGEADAVLPPSLMADTATKRFGRADRERPSRRSPVVSAGTRAADCCSEMELG